MAKTHWRQLTNPNYIGAYSLPEGNDLTVTIKSVEVQEVTGEGGQTSTKSVAVLENQKPWILNVVNQKTIERIHGPYVEDWPGKQVTLYATRARNKGEMVDVIRVRPIVTKPTIDDARLDNAIKAIKAGAFSITRLKNEYTLTSAQQEKLKKELTSNGNTN